MRSIPATDEREQEKNGDAHDEQLVGHLKDRDILVKAPDGLPRVLDLSSGLVLGVRIMRLGRFKPIRRQFELALEVHLAGAVAQLSLQL